MYTQTHTVTLRTSRLTHCEPNPMHNINTPWNSGNEHKPINQVLLVVDLFGNESCLENNTACNKGLS